MRKLLLMMGFSGALFLANAQGEAAPDPNAAEIKWESTTIDYGNVTKGDESNATRYFKFKNVGKSPLIISNCAGSCGCTVPSCPTEPILPGQSGEIKVHYDINRVGPFTKNVTVNSNAKTPSEVLKIVGTVNDAAVAPTPAPAVVEPIKATPAQPAKPASSAKPATTPVKKATPAQRATPAKKATPAQKAAASKSTSK